MTERLFVLDGPGFLFRAYHAIPFLSTSKGVPSHAVFGMSTMLWKLLREDNPEYFAVAWDPPGPTFREEKFAAYKETRAPTPDDLRTQIPLVKTLFEALRLPLLEVPGFEADDVPAGEVDDRLVVGDHPPLVQSRLQFPLCGHAALNEAAERGVEHLDAAPTQ